MRFVIGTISILVLSPTFGSIAGLLFWPELSSAYSSHWEHHRHSIRALKHSKESHPHRLHFTAAD